MADARASMADARAAAYRCEALDAESISIAITSAIASAGLGARHK